MVQPGDTLAAVLEASPSGDSIILGTGLHNIIIIIIHLFYFISFLKFYNT